MDKERRKELRHIIKRMVDLSFRDGSPLTASGINISRSGLMCESEELIDPRTEVFVHVSLPAGSRTKHIRARGEVIYVEEEEGQYLTGVRFTDMPESNARSLEAFLKAHEVSSGDEEQLDVS